MCVPYSLSAATKDICATTFRTLGNSNLLVKTSDLYKDWMTGTITDGYLVAEANGKHQFQSFLLLCRRNRQP